MNVQGYQKMTLLDYPGKVACTVFTGGCNLRCPFCHNGGLVLNPNEYQDAEEEVLLYLNKRKGIIDGVCITGGEPLLQNDLSDFIRKVKEMGLCVKLDTNGSMPGRLSEILEGNMIDYIAMDVKSSPDSYSRATGCSVSFENFRKSIDIIRNSGIDHEFRTTIVKGIHTGKDIEEIAKLLSGEEKYFLQSFKDSGNLLGEGMEAFSHNETQSILKTVQKHIPKASLRG